MPAAMISFSFSKRGQPVRFPFTRSNCRGAFMGTSMALPAISPLAMAYANHRPGDVYRLIKSISGGGFWCVHVSAEFCGHDGTASFPIGGSYTDTAKKWMQRNFHFVVGIEGLKRSRAVRMIDRLIRKFCSAVFFFH